VVVVINDLPNCKDSRGFVIEDCTGMGGIGTCGSGPPSKTRGTGIIAGDLMDGTEHGNRCIINPNSSKNRVVNNLSRECIPRQLGLFVNAEIMKEP
jgi:hypothetical protein